MPGVFTVPEAPRSRTSDVLLELARQSQSGRVSLRTLIERLGDRMFGVLLVVISALSFVPVVSILSGLLITTVGIQLAIGRKNTYIPRAILDYELDPMSSKRSLENVAARALWLERFVRPRWAFTEAPIVDRFIGILISVLGIVIAIPIPLTNVGPALIVVALAMGLLERDGVLQVAAFLAGNLLLFALYMALKFGVLVF